MDLIHSDGCHKPSLPAGKTGDVAPNGEIVDERPELGLHLLMRLRMFVVASWFPDDGEAGTPAVTT